MLRPAEVGLHRFGRAARRQENTMRNYVRRFLGARSGVTAIEYSLVAAMVALAIIISVGQLGTNLTALFNSVGTAF